MDRLTQLGLRDTGLMTLRHPNLVERYNDALEKLTGRRSSLSEFSIDATGFSPEVARELDDADYMNPLGVNLRYILVHLGQKDLVVLRPRFTSTRWIMRAFVEGNRDELFALTTKDSVYGEFEDNTYKVRSLDDLLSIKRVRITVSTPSGLAEKARSLTEMVESFTASDSMWMDDATVQRMCDHAKAAGDVRRNPSVPRNLVFEKGNYHSTHLGGVWVFHHEDRLTVVHRNPEFPCPASWQGLPVDCIDVHDEARVMEFLIARGLVAEPNRDLVLARRETLLRKLEFIVVDHVSGVDPAAALGDFGFEETKRLIYAHHDNLPMEFHEITRALKFAAHGLDWSAADVGPRTLAYLTAARPGTDRDLVNHMLAHLTPADYLGTFSANNALFMERHAEWPETRRAYVEEFLRRRLNGRGAAIFDAVFGSDDPLDPSAAHSP